MVGLCSAFTPCLSVPTVGWPPLGQIKRLFQASLHFAAAKGKRRVQDTGWPSDFRVTGGVPWSDKNREITQKLEVLATSPAVKKITLS